MYVSKRQVTMQSGIATLTAIALVLWAVGAHMFTTAEAANLTYVKDTLSDSDTGSPSNHEIQFLSPTGVDDSETITITFPAGFDLTGVDVTDIDLAEAGSDETLVGAAPGAGEWLVGVAGQVITFTSGGASAIIASNATVTIEIGTNAIGGVANAQIDNPGSINSYELSITAGAADSGQTRVAIVDNVLVTANVDTILTFTINGTTTGITVNGSGTSTATTTTSTLLPFGTLANGIPKLLAQDLTVATNARNGYVVTVMEDQHLLSSTGADIDGFANDVYSLTPAVWSAPTNQILDEKTWGHWGLTTTDPDLVGSGVDFGSNTWVGVSTTPRAILAHDGPSDGTSFDYGRATIGYQAQITALQEAGDDYSTTLTYVATPTF